MLKVNKVSLLMLMFLGAIFLSACSATTTPLATTTTPVPVGQSFTPVPSPTLLPATATPEPTATPIPPTATPVPTATATPLPSKDDVVFWKLVSEPPTPGKWIDLNLNDGFLRLMEGRKMIKALPAAWGYGVTGTESDYFSTAPGTYFIYSRYDYRWYDAVYSQRWIYSFIGFDPERANGFHSFLYDAKGNVTDNRLGAVSHGCIRVEDWRAVYDFSAIGMIVVVHNTPPYHPVPANDPNPGI